MAVFSGHVRRVGRRGFVVLALLPLFSGLADAARALDANLSPGEAFRSGYAAYKAGDSQTALEALNFAAAAGHPGALWKLGRMYATGDLVTEDDTKALELFAKVADEYADGNPRGPDAPFVANAFVTLGSYYQSGIPGKVVADPGRARRYYEYAASYFGDPGAQYSLATMILKGQGIGLGQADPGLAGVVDGANARQAARWFKLAARKGHVGAQAAFGHMLFEGQGVDRSPVEGLMWLTIASLSRPGDDAIRSAQEQAFSTATEDERRVAMNEAKVWLDAHGGADAAD